MQELVDDSSSSVEDNQVQPTEDPLLGEASWEDGRHSMKETLPEFTVHDKKNIEPDTQQWQLWEEPIERLEEHLKAIRIYTVWILCRYKSKGKQKVPAFGGFISETGHFPKRKTTIDYYPMINEPFTQYKTHKEILEMCASATREVKQDPPYPIITMDLGGIMKVMPLIWSDPDKYSPFIILIGAFHTIMNYMKMTMRKVAGSGFGDMCIEAQLVTSGGLAGVINVSGRNYNKALFSIKCISEELERRLFKRFLKDAGDDSVARNVFPGAMNDLIKNRSAENLATALEDEDVQSILEEFNQFQQQVREGIIGKTAVLWMEFLDDARLVFLLIYAVKSNLCLRSAWLIWLHYSSAWEAKTTPDFSPGLTYISRTLN